MAGKGTRLLSLDGEAAEGSEVELAPGSHTLRFESVARVESRAERPREITEVCEARLSVRPGARYELQQELVSIRGRHAWRHILSSGVQDVERDRWVGECVCRSRVSAPPPSSE